jgi:hypothetical protein
VAGTILYSQQSGPLAALGVNIEDLVGARWRPPVEDVKTTPSLEPINGTVPDTERVTAEEPLGQIPAPQEPELAAASDRNQDDSATAKTENSDKPPLTETNNRKADSIRKPPDQAGKVAKTRSQPQTYLDDDAVAAEKLEFEIYKAIYNRAIRGVEVSVIRGTAYLAGRVATERQKLAAVQAALSVPGVKDVRDQIIVGFLTAPATRDRSG